MKKLTKLLSLVLAIFIAFGTSACFGKSGSSGEDHLDIYLLYKGFGDAWLKPLMEDFVEQDWVKEKYPGITSDNISYTSNSEDADQYNKLNSGESINKYDLMFGVNLQGYEDRGLIADLTDSVYLTEVPGESGVKVIDKVPQRVLDRIRRAKAPEREDGYDTYHVVSYIDGMYGLLYNHDILTDKDGLNLPVPLTTEQFKEVGDAIMEKGYKSSLADGEKTVIMNNANDDYWRSSYDVWWAQYEGIENVNAYYEGYDKKNDLKGSSKVLSQHGRLESLQVVEDILEGYSYEFSQSGIDYKRAQTFFLEGRGIFHYNGSYFASEMAIELESCNYDIRFMKMPVISSIVEKLELYEDEDVEFNDLDAAKKKAYDEKLRVIIADVDADKTYDESAAKAAGISEDDFDIVAAARCIAGNAGSGGHAVVVPEYSPAKGIASDFLRFMFTDNAIKTFASASKGILFPSNYDVAGDAELVAQFDNVSRSSIEMLKGTSNYKFTRIPPAASTTLGKAGLTSLHFDGRFEVMFRQTGANRMTAEDILAAEAEYWSESNWTQMVNSSVQ